MDFFNQNALHAVAETTQEATEFARALQQRETFILPTASPRMLQALAQSPQPAPTHRPELARPLPSRPPPPVSSPFKPFQPEDLVGLVPNTSTLILDIRPHGQWRKARVCRAINLAVPSTLLRRPAFSLEKINTMLPNSRDREEFQKWPSASTILVYDADSSNISEASNVSALLAKIKAAGYSGELGYLYGGINSALLSSLPGVIDDSSPPDDVIAESTNSGNQFIVVRQLSMSAFQQGTTTNANQRPEPGNVAAGAPGPSTTRASVANPFYDNIRQHLELSGGITERIPLYVPKKVLKRRKELPFEWLRDIALWAGAVSMMNPAEAVPDSSARSTTGTESTYSGGSSAKRIAKARSQEGTEALAMQFYRVELGEQRRLQGVMQHHTRESGQVAKPKPISNTSDKPDYPSSIQAASMAALKSQDTRSSRGSNLKSPDEQYFPFSITAGVEKGHKNRYRNIWPFDHARVRLRSEATDDGSDYVNASYIQPRGTRRQYIATQGPLPSTYTDFWTLVWEQDVHIIVNLTKRVEGHSAKCGLYWKDGDYGPFHLKLVKEEGGTEPERAEENNESPIPPSGFDFAVPSVTAAKKARRAKAQMDRQIGKDYKPFSQENPDGDHHGNNDSSSPAEASSTEEDDDDSIIRRVFHLWHNDAPHHVRTVVQFQYVGWPDLNVPTSPKHLLKLIREVNALQEEFKESGMVGQHIETTGAYPSTSDIRLKAYRQARKDMGSRRIGPNGATRAGSPTVVHCSAGVGRTGSFILIDAILDAVRREAGLYLARPSPPAAPVTQPIDSTLMDQEPLKGRSPPLGADPGLISGQSGPFQSIARHPGGPFDSRSSLHLPEMSALSMQSPFSTSPPKQASLGDSSLITLDSAMQSSAELSSWTAPTSRQPSLPASKAGSPSVLPFSSTQSLGLSRPGLSEVGSMPGPGRDSGATKTSLSHIASAFEYTTPRQIFIPKHSREHHHSSQIAEVAAQEAARRQRHAMAASGPMDVDDNLSSPEEPPSPIGELDEPVRHVLEGIREQRMSMCQSLRQYVFVHQAILEGALQIVDEVKADLEYGRTVEVSAEASGASPFTQAAGKLPPPKIIPSLLSGVPVPPPPPPPPPPLRLGSLSVDTPSRLTAFTTGSVLGNKRLASPTELQRIDAQGASHTIHKRPSLKRINMSSDSNMESAA
ncbi:hypothetical protein M407DRAFT_24903 [Tulasnella calospora MUT 4182]|uniref:protein-tyrosine-phosphatase n=1 Tax=Tulasnella calospora MUT 4182 TaxID=1051891 RepID=A0A0C3QIF8_9AGAM|nr:hypothetical protein M407DRAFT_24903 [Tulasnella calospora MUT 4182]